ncbi:ricin-type beta-trefoil lectin domain protein [Streptomyces sp. NPDC050610]|uniref:ricin-type beta-trefoil lectin domain protein n=1 Tax=Streptomyces sp. NPDC050610 TaxID=3157097 RepID=UPI0034485CA1
MSDTEQDDAKRRRRARFASALTTSSQQPGERTRVGTRIAGATAVLALAAGATLGVGAWRTYQADEHDKKVRLAAEQTAKERELRVHTPAPHTADPKPTRTPAPTHTQDPPPQTSVGTGTEPKSAGTPSAKPKTAAEKRKEQEKKLKKAGPVQPKEMVFRSQSLVDTPKTLLRNFSTGLCMDIPGNGPGSQNTPVNQYQCDGTDNDNQLWDVRVYHKGKGPGGSDLVLIDNAKDGLCLDVPMFGAMPAGTKLIEAPCTDSFKDNQLWWFEPAGGGTVHIRNFASHGLCVTVGAKDKPENNDRRLILQKCDDGESRWRI